MFEKIKEEVLTTWSDGSKFDRALIVAFSLLLPYDLISGNWFDTLLDAVVLFWIWSSIKENVLNG